MIEPQASRFWQAAVRSGLLSESVLRKAWDAVAPEKRTQDAIDRRLARQLVNAGLLTLWQAQQILAGRWQGLRFDKYELRDVIGQGGMGRVYLAYDVRLDRKVALKILSRERMNNARAMARFRREAKVGAQLQHENLVRIYDEGEAHGVRYLVMEYIEGKTVGRLIAELGRLPARSAADITRRVALGLEHLHQKALLHRDVNPMNILIDRDGSAKLTDLGLAIDLGDDDDIVTRDGATVGTFDYISPEQAKHSRLVDPRADIYSLGCTLYHMISGRVPFPTPSLPEKLYAHQLSEPEALANFAPDLPEGLAAVVGKMMRKAPDNRYRRASDVARALEPFAVGALPASRIAAGLSSTTQETPAVNGQPRTGDAPTGSDPDLDLRRASPPFAPTPNTPASDPLNFIPKIDLGPEPSLSASRSGVRSKPKVREAGPRRPIPWRPLLIGLTASAVAAAGAGLFRWWKNLPPSRANPFHASASGTGRHPLTNEPLADIAIRYPNGNELAQASLRDAIARLSGRGGEIVLRTNEPIRAGELGKTLRLDGGHLVIRADGGARPEVIVEVSGAAPWIEVATQARLSLVGLAIRVESTYTADVKPGESTPTLLAVEGKVSLERCSFRASGADRTIRALASRGLEARLNGCHFDGFDQPIVLEMYPGANVSLAHCLFVRDAAGPGSGWAIAAISQIPRIEGSRKLGLDRCTAIGSGLLVAEGFEPDAPLTVSVVGTAIRASALAMTTISKADLAKALAWTGRGNDYAISGASWVVLPPRGSVGMPGAPSDLKTWAEFFPADTQGDDAEVKFAAPPIGEGRPPADYAVIVGSGKPAVGADPAKVGPAVAK